VLLLLMLRGRSLPELGSRPTVRCQRGSFGDLAKGRYLFSCAGCRVVRLVRGGGALMGVGLPGGPGVPAQSTAGRCAIMVILLWRCFLSVASSGVVGLRGCVKCGTTSRLFRFVIPLVPPFSRPVVCRTPTAFALASDDWRDALSLGTCNDSQVAALWYAQR